MKQYIDKDALLDWAKEIYLSENASMIRKVCYKQLVEHLGTIKVKEVENKFEIPKIDIKDAIEVNSRMKYIDDDLKPIANFILDYASWNLHKDEWNQPTIEVPLFRVLDALIQRGKGYCCS